MMNKDYLIKLVGVLVLGSVAWYFFVSKSNDLPNELEDRWQAVFLDDGQVYFGKLEDYNHRYVSLNNVYYLKRTSDLETMGNLNLIKLGGEAHGPEGEMFISKDKILFFENLKDTSVVVKAIKNNIR